MKKNLIQLLALAFVLLSNVMPSWAQEKASDRKELFGVWYAEWLKYDKEEEVLHIKDTQYTILKVYRPDGEYASLQAWSKGDGVIVLLPHEYGTYSYKNGEYIEMGRKTIPGKIEFKFVNEDTRTNRWYNCTDQAKKIKNCPKALEQYFVDCCKQRTMQVVDDAEFKDFIKKHIFGIK